MSLAALQQRMADFIHDRPSDISEALADRRGLAVYRHAYRATLRGVLRDTYARTAQWLGDDRFDEIADAYVVRHPSRSWTLDAYGRDFPLHLAQALPDDPETAELAWLEGALRCAFVAAEVNPVDHAALANVDWDTARISFVAGVAVRMVAHDVPAIWHALTDGAAPLAWSLDGPIGLLVWRTGFEPLFRSADAREAETIANLLGGASFAEACVALSHAGLKPQQVGSWLAGWISDGLIESVS